MTHLHITKTYTDFPAGHRQPSHKGHCRYVHGHNYDFVIEFGCTHLDENGFIVDFGDIGYVKDWLNYWFDHTLFITNKDPEVQVFLDMGDKGLAQLRVVDSSSAEGLADMTFKGLDELVRFNTNSRAWVSKVTVFEDKKNSATRTP